MGIDTHEARRGSILGLSDPEVHLLEEEVSHDTWHGWKPVFECVGRRRKDRLRVWVFIGVLSGQVGVGTIVAAKLRKELAKLHRYPFDVRAVLVSGWVDGFYHDFYVARLFREIG